MVGLLYLPRLFVYHSRVDAKSDAYEIFKIMEHKLLKIIMLPAMILTVTSGVLLTYIIGIKGNYWLHIKIFCALVLILIHYVMIRFKEDFENNRNKKSERFFRIFNEMPTIFMILIVYCAVFKPW